MELFKGLGSDTGPQQFPVITGPYLGQEPKPVDRFPVYVGVMVSPDGKYLFTYNQWVSADFIGEMRSEE